MMSPYSEQDGAWYQDRRPEDQYDTWKSAAEALAAHVEVYLFDKKSPFYQDPVYLSWCVSQYDTNKMSSGHAFNYHEYSPDAAASVPTHPADLLPDDHYKGAIGYSHDAKVDPQLDTGPNDPGPKVSK